MLCPKSADRRPDVTLLINKRKPIGIGEILVEEFLQPMGLPQGGALGSLGGGHGCGAQTRQRTLQ